jgi:ribonuclease HI
MEKVTIYTDGACSGNPGPGGWAAILISGEQEKEIGGHDHQTTNNRMELTAAIEALRALKHPCESTIYSDSAYFVHCFKEGWMDKW